MLEELLTYSRYKNYTWANAAREMNGPIDFHLNGLGVQLKTIKTVDTNNASQISNFRAKIREGLDQLVTAKNNGWNGLSFSSTRLDVMIPPGSDIHINRLTEIIGGIINDPAKPQYSSMNLQIGIFND